MGTHKPEEWTRSLIARLEDQLPYRCGSQTITTRLNEEKNRRYLIQISCHRFSLVISGLTKILQKVSEQVPNVSNHRGNHYTEHERNCYESIIIVLETLEQCFVIQAKETTNKDETMNVKLLLKEICQFLRMPNESPYHFQIKNLASKVLFALSQNFFTPIFNRISQHLQDLTGTNDENPDCSDIELIPHININLNRLIQLMNEAAQKSRLLKKSPHITLINSLERAIWNWMDIYPQEFADIQRKSHDNLSKICGELFEVLDSFVENKKGRAAIVWPLQILLLILSPATLEALVNADSGAPCSPKHSKKKLFVDGIRRSLSSNGNSGKQLTEAAIISSVKLCKASTYIYNLDSGNVTFKLVHDVIGDLTALLFNLSKPFSRGHSYLIQDTDLMIDYFVSIFRIKPHNDEILKVCLNVNSPCVYQFVLVSSLYRIATQSKISWWPKNLSIYPKSGDIRRMFIDTLNKVAQGYGSQTPLKIIQSFAMKGKEQTKYKDRAEDIATHKNLLLWIVRLIHTDPMLMLYTNPNDDHDIQTSTLELINGLVSLLLQPTMPDIADEAMEALIVLHHPDNIKAWNPEAPMNAFWDISSQVLFAISQKLIQHQIVNYIDILKWLKEILIRRNIFLSENKHQANIGSRIAISTQALIKLEAVFFIHLWNIDMEAVLISLSSFTVLCKEADIRCESEEIATTTLLPNYHGYMELAKLSTALLTTDRIALQKRIMRILRKINHCKNGVQVAWEETFRSWESVCRYLIYYPKDKGEDVQIDSLLRSSGKRRSSHRHSELEELIHEWAYMTGFLCALGGVCVEHKSLCRPKSLGIIPSPDSKRSPRKSQEGSLENSDQDVQYSPVTQFVSDLIFLLTCNNAKCGVQIHKHVKELVGREMSPALYPILFDEIKSVVEKFFNEKDEAVINDDNTQFIVHVIYIMKNILESKADRPSEYLGATSIEAMTSAIVRYVKYMDITVPAINIKTELCHFIKAMMKRRDDLAFRQEMKFRNKLVEYLSDWIMPITPEVLAPPTAEEITQMTQNLEQACIEAVGAVLRGLPLQPEESERGELMEAKSQLFLRYFSLFMNSLNDPNEPSSDDSEEDVLELRFPSDRWCKLRSTTIQAMSNLLSANIDSGLMYSIGLGYNRDLQTRVAFMEVLTKILQQGTEFDTLAETVLADRYEQLVQLVTMITDKGELPIVMALANAIPSNEMNELAQVLVVTFDSKRLLAPLLWSIFYREVELTDCMETLFRGNSLASKMMSFCFQMYGSVYLQDILQPLIDPLLDDPMMNFEVDPAKIKSHDNIQQNCANVLELTEQIFDAIVSSVDEFPCQLRSMCHCLYQVFSKRFPQSPDNNIDAVGTAFFLRFVNPAIVAPKEHNIVQRTVPPYVRRGLTLTSKILQNIANHVNFTKEQYMMTFNDFLNGHFEITRQFFVQIATDYEPLDQTSPIMSYVSDANVVVLHGLIWNNQEQIGNYLNSSRDDKAMGRRSYDKMATLLAYLGPPEHKPVDSHCLFPHKRWSSRSFSATSFEAAMILLRMKEKEEFEIIKSLNIFYQSGRSRQGNPVFYYIARRFKTTEVNADLLIYHVLLILRAYRHSKIELVIDLTHVSADNRFRTEYLQKWFYVFPRGTYTNIVAAYIYNCNDWAFEYIAQHESVLSALNAHPKLSFIESIEKLNDVIEPDQQKLPGSTVTLNDDVKIFPNVLRLSHRDTKVTLKIGPTAMQIVSHEKCKILSHFVLLNDVYYASEMEEVSMVDEEQLTVNISDGRPPLSFMNRDADAIVVVIFKIRNRWELSQPEDLLIHTKIKPKDVPGTLLNMALLNLGSSDPDLRIAAYNQLCVLTSTFNLKIEGQLLENSCLCIPSNNTIFITHLSETLATNDPHLTLEFLEECVQGFKVSTTELKHLCLEYMTPWLKNLVKFCKPNPESGKRKKQVKQILEKLISLTIEEVDLYPSIQAKIWSTIGRLPELIDTVLDNFIQKSIGYGFGSPMVEIMADTAVALASGNVQLVANKIIGRLCTVVDKTCTSPALKLEQHMMWNDIAILARYLLMLSFNNCLDVGKHLPYLFHTVTFLLYSGSLCMRASTHGLVINIIHSLCTCSSPSFSKDTHKILRMSLDEFSLPKFYLLFGISQVKSATVTAFKSNYRHPNDTWLAPEKAALGFHDRERLSLTNLEIVTDALLDIMEACMRDIPCCNWLNTWTSLAKSFAFCFNPALQPRALVVFGCISKSITENEIKQLLRILIKALENFTDITLMEAVIMCLTKLQSLLEAESPIHNYIFWVAILILQLDESTLYGCGLALLEQNLHILHYQGAFEEKKFEKVMMSIREPLELHFKQLDTAVGLSFKANFHFALVGHLLKGYRHAAPTTVTRTARVLTMLLAIVCRSVRKNKFEVTQESVSYLVALVHVSKDVQSRCRIKNILDGNVTELKPPDDLPDKLIESPSVINPPDDIVNEEETSCDLLDQTAVLPPQKRKSYPPEEPGQILFETQRSFTVPGIKESQFTDVFESKNEKRKLSISYENNFLLNPDILTDLSTQTLVLSILATLVKYSTDENQTRILYQYLAEGSLVFPKVFPVINSLIDAKITSVLSSCNDQVTINAVQVIIQNMIACDDTGQHLHYLQSCGFGGLWRFAGPFSKVNHTEDSTELCVNCLEAMVETCLPSEESTTFDQILVERQSQSEDNVVFKTQAYTQEDKMDCGPNIHDIDNKLELKASTEKNTVPCSPREIQTL